MNRTLWDRWDRWLRKPGNRAILALLVLTPCFLLLVHSTSLPDVSGSDAPDFAPRKLVDNINEGTQTGLEEEEDAALTRKRTSAILQSVRSALHPPPPPRQHFEWPPSPPPPPPPPPPAQADAASLPFLLPNCKNVDAECDTWRGQGECEANPGYMSYNCMLACGGCHTAYLHAIPRSLPIAEGVWMPTIGFGTAALGDRTADAVESALKAGYRLLDSAQAREWYREDLVGAGLAASGVDREEVFLTTKIHPRNLGYWATLTAFDDSLRDLRTDYVDLVLLHYPECSPSLCGNGVLPEGDFKESWAALEQLVDEKRVRAIGVSNFNIQQLSELLRTARIRPALLQARSDVLRAGRENWAWCRRHNITFQGYSTLGAQHGGAGNPVLEHPLLRDVARAKARAPAQVALRWALGHGQAVVPRASSKGHLAQNLVADSFDLADQEMQDLDALDGTSPRVEQ